MASRVTPAEVKAILTTTLTDPVIQTWIDAANAAVNDNAACIGGDDALLKQVELYLSAHFVGMLDPGIRGFISKEKTEELETSYSNPAGVSELINSTVYGQTANMLSKGCLANVADKASSVEFF